MLRNRAIKTAETLRYIIIARRLVTVRHRTRCRLNQCTLGCPRCSNVCVLLPCCPEGGSFKCGLRLFKMVIRCLCGKVPF